MKLTAVLYLLLCTFQPPAHGASFTKFLNTIESRPWVDVTNDPHLIVNWPTINIQGQYVPINKVCDNGETFSATAVVVCTEKKLISKVACTQYEQDQCHVVNLDYKAKAGEVLREQFACTKTERRDVETSRVGDVLKCTEDVVFPHDDKSSAPYCPGQWIWKQELLSGTYKVPVISKASLYSDQGPRVLALKTYVIQCN